MPMKRSVNSPKLKRSPSLLRSQRGGLSAITTKARNLATSGMDSHARVTEPIGPLLPERSPCDATQESTPIFGPDSDPDWGSGGVSGTSGVLGVSLIPSGLRG